MMENNKELFDSIDNWTFYSYDYLRKNYTDYKHKRELLKSFDLFFCERRTASLMKKALGTKFFIKKKFPYPLYLDDLLSEKKLNEEKFKKLLLD